MHYRFRMHWYADPNALLTGGRPLFGHDPAAAAAQAERLWAEGAYAAASGCCVVDTEDGTIVWAERIAPAPLGRARAPWPRKESRPCPT